MEQCRLLENYQYIVAQIKTLEHTCQSNEEFKKETIRLVGLATPKDLNNHN